MVVLTDIPDDDIDDVVADFESDGLTVEKKRQSDGKWTVHALYPDEQYSKGGRKKAL